MNTTHTTAALRTAGKHRKAALRRAWKPLAGSIAALLLGAATPGFAGSATWNFETLNGDWNTAGNWTPATIPNSGTDTATFATSSTTGVSLSAPITVDTINFSVGASAFTISIAHTSLAIGSTGIVNNSGITQAFMMSGDGGGLSGGLSFGNGSTAGSGATFTNSGATVSGTFGGITSFLGSAGSGTFTNNPGTVSGAFGGQTTFSNSATAGSGIFINNGGAVSSTFSGGSTGFGFFSGAGTGTFTNNGGTASGGLGGSTEFSDQSSAVSGTFTNNPGTVSGALGGFTKFSNTSKAGSGTFINKGATISGALGGITQFFNTATAGSANFTTRGGAAAGAKGGTVDFFNSSTAANGNFTNDAGTVAGSSPGTTLGGSTVFHDTATAATGIFTNNPVTVLSSTAGSTVFRDASTAGSSHITNNSSALFNFFLGGGGVTAFNDTSTAASAVITNNAGTLAGVGPGEVNFLNTANAGSSAITNKGGIINVGLGGRTFFQNSSTANTGVFVNEGGTVNGAAGGRTAFVETASAASGNFTNNGGTASGGGGGSTEFFGTSTAGSATLIANAGTGGGEGGSIQFLNDSTGGTAIVKVFSSGTVTDGGLDISQHNAPGVTIGSIEGSGKVFLAANNLTVGGNNLDKTFSGVISDAGGATAGTGGSLTKTGTGTLTFSGINTYTGPTIVSGGRLLVNGSLAGVSAVSVGAGATLGGTGTVGATTFASNAILAPGTSPGTLTMGNASFTNLSQLNYELGTPNVVGGVTNDLTIVNGNLTLDGVLNITNAGGFAAGTYRLFTYTGTLTDNALTFGTVPSGFTTANLTLQTSVANQIDLIVDVGMPGQFWNGPNTTATAGVLGGTGTWNNVATNWTDSTGAANTNWQQGVATFSAGAGTVTLGANISATELRFVSGSGAYKIVSDANHTLTIGGAGVVNSSGIAQNFETATNGQSGTITFINQANAGTNAIYTNNGDQVSLSSAGAIQFNDNSSAGSATLRNLGGAFVSVDAIQGEIGGFGGQTTFRNNSTAASSMIQNFAGSVGGGVNDGNGHITGGGAFGGSTIFTDNSTAANATITNFGGTALNASGGSVTFFGNATAADSTIVTKGADAATSGRGITSFNGASTAANAILIADGGTNGGLGGLVQFSGTASGGSAKAVANAGGLFDFSALSTAGTTLGSIEGAGTFDLGLGNFQPHPKTLTVGSLNTATEVSGIIQGAGGGLTKVGSATLALGGINTYTGPTTVSGGVLLAKSTSAFGIDSAVTVNGGGTLDLGGKNNTLGSLAGTVGGIVQSTSGPAALTTGTLNTNTTFSGTIQNGQGPLSFVKTGSGIQTLTGTNTYTGNTNINAGALIVNGSIASVTTQVSSGATLGGTGLVGGLVTVANGGILAPGTSPGTLTVGALTLNNTSQVNFELGAPNVIGGGVNDLMIVNAGLTLDGVLNISNTGGFGAGTYRLFNYTGTLTDNALSFGTIPGGFTAADLTIQTSVANQINLIVGGGVVLPGQHWNGPNTSATAGVLGGTGTWNNVATNWTDSTGAANTNWKQGVAVFSAGSGTATLGANITATELRFQPGSGAYTVTTGVNTLTITGAGIANTSGITQNFVTVVNGEGTAGTITFTNSATAGSNTTFTNSGGIVSAGNVGLTRFLNNATAGSGAFTNNGGTVSGAFGGDTQFHNAATASGGTFTNIAGTVSGAFGGITEFFDSSVAGNGQFTSNGAAASGALGGVVEFHNTSAASTGTFTNFGATAGGGATGGLTQFFNGSTADHGTFINKATTVPGAAGFSLADAFTGAMGSGALSGATLFGDTSTAASGSFTNDGAGVANAIGGIVAFTGTATAGNGTFTNHGGTVSDGFGGFIVLAGTSTAGNATFTNNGGTATGANGGVTAFAETSTAGNATLIANGGTGGGGGGVVLFLGDSTGGTARVIVGGNGELDISGHNAPGVTVGSIEGNGEVYLGTRNLTVGSNNLSTTFSGVIQQGGEGSGSFTKIGTGTLILSGNNTYTGDTNINGGRLTVNGSIASANVFINPGGTLGGTGNVMGHVTSSGFVSPGNSPGTLTIGGNYRQLANGTLQIAVAGAQPGQFSVLAVGGKATLDGTLQVVKENGATVKAGDRLRIVTAVGGVSGVFSSTVNPFATGSMLGIQVIYESNAVLLAFVQNSFVQLATITGQTPNQTAVARTLDQIVSDPRAAQVIAFLNGEPLGNIPGDLDKIGPADLTSIFHIAKSLTNVQSANILRRTEEIRSEAGSGGTAAGNVPVGGGAQGPVGRRSKEIAPADDKRWGMFFTGSGEFTHVGSTTNAAGWSTETGGVTAGVDYRFTDHFAAGISLGYMNTTASLANGGKIDADGGRVGAYATYFKGGLHLDAAVSGGPNSYATRRTMPNNTVATGSPDGSEVNLTFAAGYDWKFRGLTIGPTASFQYTNVQLDGFTERGTFAPLNIVKKNADSARSALGFRATFDTQMGSAILRHEVRAAWQHEFGDTSYSLTSTFATLGGSAFTVAGPETGRDSLLIGAGFSILWNERFSTYAYYDGELGRSNYDSHNVSAGCRLRF